MKYLMPLLLMVLALMGANGIYVVSQGHAAVRVRLGAVEAVGIGPGLHFKVPFLDRVSIYDTRAVLLQAQPDDYTTRGGERASIGYFVRWRVADAARYWSAAHADESQATRQMTPLVADAVRALVARHSTAELLAADGSGDAGLRDTVATRLRQQLGIDVLAVGIRRVMPTDSGLPAVYQRMSAAAKERADAIRSEGAASTAALRARGDAADAAALAAASGAAALDRGQGDVAAAKVYAQAAAQDPAFFRYWSALDTWRKTFGEGGAVIVLGKDSPLLQAVDQGASAGAGGKDH